MNLELKVKLKFKNIKNVPLCFMTKIEPNKAQIKKIQ